MSRFVAIENRILSHILVLVITLEARAVEDANYYCYRGHNDVYDDKDYDTDGLRLVLSLLLLRPAATS